MDGGLLDKCGALPQGDAPLNGPLLATALRRIHYSEMQNSNAVMKAAEVRAFP